MRLLALFVVLTGLTLVGAATYLEFGLNLTLFLGGVALVTVGLLGVDVAPKGGSGA